MTIWIILGLLFLPSLYVTSLVLKNDDRPNKPRNPNDGQGHDSIVGGAQ